MFYRVAALSAVLAALLTINISTFAQNGRSDNNQLMPLQTNPGSAAPDDILPSFAAINGSVRSTDDRPVADARVEIREIGTGKSVAVGYTSPAGTFGMSRLPKGRYEVVATSGLSESREQVQLDGIDASVTLRLPHLNTSDGGQQTISVAEMRIPDKAKNEVKKARSAMAKSNPEEASKHIAKALEIAPTFSEALTLRGLISLSSGHNEAASNDFTNAIKNDPNDATAYVAMGALENMNQKFDDAIRELDRGISLEPNSWQAYFEMSKAKLGKGDFEGSLRQATKAEELAGNGYGPIHLVKGHAFLGLKSYPDAIGEFEKYLSLEKDGPATTEVRQQLQEIKSFAATARK